jgi:DNA polymerase I
MGFCVLHGIVDCLWVQGSPIGALKDCVEQTTGLSTEVEHFDWIVFLPQNDGSGSYNRYFGRLSDGSVKVRGIAARRHDTPEYIRAMQREMLTVMAGATNPRELGDLRDQIRKMFRDAAQRLPGADVNEMAISRRISRLTYAHRCIEGAAVRSCQHGGIGVAPGMKISYVVRDAAKYQVDPAWSAGSFDVRYYRGLLDKAWAEIAYAFTSGSNDRVEAAESDAKQKTDDKNRCRHDNNAGPLCR